MAREPLTIDRIKDPLVREYITECARFSGWSRNFMLLQLTCQMKFHQYRESFLPGKTLVELTSQDIQSFFDWTSEMQLAESYQKKIFESLKRLYVYVVGKGYGTTTPMDTEYKLRGTSPSVVGLVTPQEVFMLRQRATKHQLIDIAAFEFMLCTGLRANELVQVAPIDIKLGDIPMDRETCMPSRYVVGSVTLSPDSKLIKQDKQRKAYISVLAWELMLKHIKQVGLKMNSRIPIFPYDRRKISIAVSGLCDGVGMIYPEKIISKLNPADYSDARETVAEDVMETDEFDAITDERFKEILMNTAKNEVAQREKYGMRRNVPEDETKRNMSALRLRDKVRSHIIRYTNICYMYFRSFDGARNSRESVSFTSGHAFGAGFSGTNSTGCIERYLASHQLVDNDVQWRTLWLGKPSHWLLFRG